MTLPMRALHITDRSLDFITNGVVVERYPCDSQSTRPFECPPWQVAFSP